jgi:hypothetical protein
MSKPKPSSSHSPRSRKNAAATPLRVYNDIVIGLDVLFDAAVSGDRMAFLNLKAMANHIIWLAGRCDTD